MLKRHGCHLVFLSIICILLSPSALASPQTEVRVRLQKQLYSVDVSGFVLRIAPPSGYINAASEAGDIHKARIRLIQPGKWKIEWSKDRVQMLEGHRLLVRGQMLRLGAESVPAELELIENDRQGFDIVCRMGIDAYLGGVLPSEMPLSWPIEALKAQAVAARSYVLRTMFERRESHFDVDSTIIDQVYKFWHDDSMRADWREKLAKVLKQTSGEILTDERGRVLKAFYHADCGCQTEDPKYVWGASKSFSSVKDPTCGQRKTYQWNLSLADQDVQSKLAQYFKLPSQASLRNLSILSRTPSGRVALLAANFSFPESAANYTLNAQDFRKLFGFQKVLSSNFNIQRDRRNFRLNGQGLGHGVGLCQWGARAMAENGINYTTILKNFYPKAFFRTSKEI